TPDGTAMGALPIRLMAASPHVAEDFAAHPALARLAVGDESLAGRDDGHTQATQHPGQLLRLGVDPQAWLGDAPDGRDGASAVGRVLHANLEDAAGTAGVVLHRGALDVSLTL